MAARNYNNTSPTTSLSVALGTGSTLTVVDSSGFPSVPFTAAIDRGESDEEVVLVTDVPTGTTMTVTRGFDGTSNVNHDIGSSVEHVVIADDYQTANDHIFDTGRDDHTQLMHADGSRHDLSARHTFGAALPSPAAPANVGTAANAGSAAGPPRADHVHMLASGVAGAGLALTAGVLNIPDGGVAAVKLSQEAWTDYTPALSNWTVGNGNIAGRWMRYGNTIVTYGRLLLGSTSGTSGNLRVGAPVAARVSATFTLIFGGARYLDAGARNYGGDSSINLGVSASTITFAHHQSGNNGTVNGTNPFTFGNADAVWWSLVYEAG